MKTIEQQKAELLDKFVIDIAVCIDDPELEVMCEMNNAILKEYNALNTPKESTNPYIDEIFDMRICNVISDIMYKPVKKIRLSDCPHISKLDKRKNIGFGSIQAYESTMQKYGLNDKLI